MKIILSSLVLILMVACASSKNQAEVAKTVETNPEVSQKIKEANDKKEDIQKKSETTEANLNKKKNNLSTDASSLKSLICKSGSEERKLEIQTKEKGCELLYTRLGETKTIATQIVGHEKCEQVLAGIQEKLVASSFKCE